VGFRRCYTPSAPLGLLEAGALCTPYKSADENLGFEANCATKINFQTGSKEVLL
jgi:hypothetical protein